MSQNRKVRTISASSRRPEPPTADYSDEITDEVLEKVRKVAASKMKKGQQLEIIHESSW